jgi:hypothetical protein
MRRWVEFALALCVVFLPFMSSSCVDDGDDRRLNVFIDANVPIPSELDEVDVSLTGSRTESGNFCLPVNRLFVIENSNDLPLGISVRIGDVYNRWIASRIIGRRQGIEVFRHYTIHPLFDVQSVDYRIAIERECYGILCMVGHHCQGGDCLVAPSETAFSSTAAYDDVSCEDIEDN